MTQSLSVTLTLVIDSLLSFTPNSLPHGLVGQPYPPTAIGTVSGGIAPYTFVAKSAPPPGMTLSSAGVLSGTPTSGGSYSLAVEIDDSGTP